MRKFLILLLVLLVLPMQAMAAEAVRSMIDGLPTVEEFQGMDSARQKEAYDRTQAAYDAYMALSGEEKDAIAGAEETFEALFAHYNTLIAPAEEAPEEGESDAASNVVSTALAALAGLFLAQRIVTKRRLKR